MLNQYSPLTRMTSCLLVVVDAPEGRGLGAIHAKIAEESTFEKYVRKYQGNSLSQSGKRCELGDDISGIYRHVRMPTSFENIFPDFADISIRGKLLALSMSMKMLFRLVSLHHLHKNRRGQMHLMREIAQYICRMFFRKQMRKCK